MSHVIGQGTIASNHYRTPEYRASQYQSQPVEQFNSEQSEWGAATTSQTKKAIKALTDLLPQIRKQMTDGTLKGLEIEKLLKNSDGDIIKKLQNVFKKGDTIDPDNMQYLRKLMKGEKFNPDGSDARAMAKSLNSKTGATPIPDLDKKSLDAAADSLQEGIQGSAFSPRQKTLLKYTTGTAVGITTIGMLIFGPGSDFLNKWANYSTGLDCPEKAAGRGYEEGTPEYAEAVKTCQEGTMESLMRLGYSAMAIVGFVGLIAVTRAIPKRKAKTEPEEDSEDEE